MDKSFNKSSRKLKIKENHIKNKKHLSSHSSKNFYSFHEKTDNKNGKLNHYIIKLFLKEMDKAMEEIILSDEIPDEPLNNFNSNESKRLLLFKGTFKESSDNEEDKIRKKRLHRHKSHLPKIHHHIKSDENIVKKY